MKTGDIAQLLYIRLKAGLDMAFSEGEQEEYENFLDGVTYTMAIRTGITREGFGALERLAIGVYEL